MRRGYAVGMTVLVAGLAGSTQLILGKSRPQAADRGARVARAAYVLDSVSRRTAWRSAPPMSMTSGFTSRFRMGFRLTALAIITALPLPALGQRVAMPAREHTITAPAISLDIQQFSKEFAQWTREFTETGPSVVTFRALTRTPNLAARWYVLANPNDPGSIVAQGDAGPLDPGKPLLFVIDFRAIVGVNGQRPISYWVKVVGFERTRMQSTGGSKRYGPAKQQAKDMGPATVPAGAPTSNVGRVNIAPPGSPTDFTFTGLRPDLLHTMPVGITLDSLRATGDTDVEPYLLVATIYFDGTTIIPELDLSARKVRFTNSTVRVQGTSATHGNVLSGGDMDSGQKVPIPPATGRFEAVVRPIGIQLVTKMNRSESEKRALRTQTVIATLVIGMEEDQVPSTETADQLNAEFLTALREELEAMVRGFTMDETTTKLPDVREAVGGLQSRLQSRLTESAKARTLDELSTYLAIHGSPLLAAFGAANADDYIGVGVATVTYQQLLDAAEAGVPFKLELANGNEAVKYVIDGRFSVR